MSFFKKLLLFWVLISISATGVMYLIQPLESLEDRLIVYNNDLICKEEIRSMVLEDFEAGKAFILYNPLKFSEKLEKHPLIKDAIIRTNLFPRKRFTILVNEEKPWAMFRNKIFNRDFKIIKDFSLKDNQENCDSVLALYDSILNNTSSVIKISSNRDLDIKDFKKLEKTVDNINDRLKMISQSPVIKVEFLDNELKMANHDIELLFGDYHKRIKNKLEKFDHLLSKIQENIHEIAYIDLSLETDEIIIGKKQ